MPRLLLRRVIVSFGNEFADAVSAIEAAIGDGRLVEAERLAHTLAGVARQLDAAELAAAAGDFEHAIRAGKTAFFPACARVLTPVLERAVAAARSLDAPAGALGSPYSGAPPG